MKLGFIIIILSIIVIISSWVKYSTDDYYKDKSIACKIVYKFEPLVHRSYTDFILVLMDPKGRKFHLNVNPTTYATHEVGETLYFNLSEFDITGDDGSRPKYITIILVSVIMIVVGIFIIAISAGKD